MKVSDQLVTVTSYSRPTKRKYYNKLNEIAWMETVKINEPDVLGLKMMRENSGQIDILRNSVI